MVQDTKNSDLLKINYYNSIKTLHRIHKILLHLVEDKDAENQYQAHEDEAVGEPAPAYELAGTEEAVFEGFQHGGDGVEAHQGVDIDAFPHQARGLAEGIDDRGGIHPELHQEREEDLQVAILGGERGDNHAEAERKAGNHHDQQREKQRIGREMRRARRVEQRVGRIHQCEQAELDAEAQQIADDIGQGHDQPREIDLPEDAGILDKGVGGPRQAIGKILPQAHTAQIEQGLRNPVGGNAGDAAEHHHIHNDGQCGLNDIPYRTQDRLFVLRDDMPLDKQGAEVAVAPQFFEINREETVFRFDDKVPGIFVFCHVEISGQVRNDAHLDRLCLKRMLPRMPQK